MQSGYQFESIDPQNSLIVTASQRLARHLREQYNRWQASQGKSVWPTLQVMPWGAFTNTLWQQLNEQQPLPHRLSDQQCLYLWQGIIEDSSWNDYLLNIKATASKAWQAWQLYQQWQLDIEQSLAWDKDTLAFKDWAQAFASRLQQQHWIDSASSINLLIEQLADTRLPLAATLYTAGFEQTTPQQEQLFAQLEPVLKVTPLRSSKKAAEPQVLSFNSSREEFRAAIRHAKEAVLAALEQDPGSQFRYAIVVPELEKHKPLIERLLWQELTPSLSPEQPSLPGVFDISLGEPLAGQPLVITALNLLQWLNGSVEKVTLQQLLLSPYWGRDENTVAGRAELDKALRKSHKQRFTLNDLSEWQPQVSESLRQLLTSLQRAQRLVKDKQLLSDWMTALPSLLEAAEWPGYRTLNSREYQIQQALFESFNQLRQYQVFYAKPISFSTLLELLVQLLSDAQFHQELPRAPIQIMGLLETLGLEFDEVWLTGATYQVLPAQPSPNPFIDKQTLKKHQMPGSSTQRELQYARQLFASLQLASSQLTVSYPRFEGSSELLPSPLLAQFNPQEVPAQSSLASQLLQELRVGQEAALESYQDSHGQPLADGPVKGGTGFFKEQINCPFKAYMKYRLKAEPFEEVEQGLNAMERGILVHRVLELFWQAHASSEVLADKDRQQLAQLIAPYLTQVLDEFKADYYFLTLEQYARNEHQRLLTQLTEALMLDSRRPPFAVREREKNQSIAIEGLSFNLTIDRIDEVEDGLLIIDYKTGSPSRSKLYSQDPQQPPEEPQLALYAINQFEQPVAGVSFLNINAKEIRYQGIADEVAHLALTSRSAIKEPMSDVIARWQLQLGEVAQQMKAGTALVDPRACDYCEYAAACRINQRHTVVQEDEA